MTISLALFEDAAAADDDVEEAIAIIPTTKKSTLFENTRENTQEEGRLIQKELVNSTRTIHDDDGDVDDVDDDVKRRGVTCHVELVLGF